MPIKCAWISTCTRKVNVALFSRFVPYQNMYMQGSLHGFLLIGLGKDCVNLLQVLFTQNFDIYNHFAHTIIFYPLFKSKQGLFEPIQRYSVCFTTFLLSGRTKRGGRVLDANLFRITKWYFELFLSSHFWIRIPQDKKILTAWKLWEQRAKLDIARVVLKSTYNESYYLVFFSTFEYTVHRSCRGTATKTSAIFAVFCGSDISGIAFDSEKCIIDRL